MPRGRRRNAPEAIGRWRRDSAAEFARSARATGCEGTRMPTLSCPPVTTSATLGARGRISVSGPGQNAAASLRAPSGTERVHFASCAVSYKWTMTGWSAGRPFAANILLTASRARVGAEPVDRLGRKCDQFARAQSLGRPRYRRAIGRSMAASSSAASWWTSRATRGKTGRRADRRRAGSAEESARIQTFAGCAQPCANTAQGSGNE